MTRSGRARARAGRRAVSKVTTGRCITVAAGQAAARRPAEPREIRSGRVTARLRCAAAAAGLRGVESAPGPVQARQQTAQPHPLWPPCATHYTRSGSARATAGLRLRPNQTAPRRSIVDPVLRYRDAETQRRLQMPPSPPPPPSTSFHDAFTFPCTLGRASLFHRVCHRDFSSSSRRTHSR